MAKHCFGGQKLRFWVAAGAIPSSRADGCIDILVPLVAADHDTPYIDTECPHLQIIFPMNTSIYGGFSIATFDYQGVIHFYFCHYSTLPCRGLRIFPSAQRMDGLLVSCELFVVSMVRPIVVQLKCSFATIEFFQT